MAAPTAPAPPPAPPAPSGVNIIPPTTPPKPPVTPPGEIRLGQPKVHDPGPQQPPKPGSARERMVQSLRQKAGSEKAPEQPAPPAPAPSPAPPPAESPSPEGEEPSGEPGGQPSGSPDAAAPPAAATPDPKTKTNPWKLLDTWKQKTAALEKELADARKGLAEPDRKQYLTQIEQLTKRNKDLEDHMRFMDYEQSGEFKEKYDVPYRKAWERAVAEMSELQVTDENGNVRQVNQQDLFALVNLPLQEARQRAVQLYGEFADDMMAHRKELRTLFSARAQALDEAKKNGAERLKQQAELHRKTVEDMRQANTSHWEKSQAEFTKDEKYGKYFTPVEGDQDGNQRLAKGFDLVDRAFSENPEDPNFTPEQRASAIRRLAAVRFRAAAFGRLVAVKDRLEAQVAELTKELSQYKSSTPPSGGSPPGPGEQTPARASDRVYGALRKLAR